MGGGGAGERVRILGVVGSCSSGGAGRSIHGCLALLRSPFMPMAPADRMTDRTDYLMIERLGCSPRVLHRCDLSPNHFNLAQSKHESIHPSIHPSIRLCSFADPHLFLILRSSSFFRPNLVIFGALVRGAGCIGNLLENPGGGHVW